MTPRQNADVDLSNTPGSVAILNSLYDASKGKGEGRIKCTLTKHRIAKAAVLLGIRVLLKRSPDTLLKTIEQWAPLRKPGPVGSQRARAKAGLALECSSTQGLLEGVDRVWRLINGEASHRRVLKACMCIGLDAMSRVNQGKVRQLVSKLSPVKQKYWDPELGLWL